MQKFYQEFSKNSIFFGVGLYQVIIGILLNLLISVLLSISIIVFYPIINPMILIFFKVIGWIIVIIGIITGTFPLIRKKLLKNKVTFQVILIILHISAFLCYILIPIGIPLGLSLRFKLKSYKANDPNRLNTKYNNITSMYYFLIFFTGFTHILIGALLLFGVIPLLTKEIKFLFPYVNFALLNILSFFGWICFIPGIVLIFCSIWSRKLSVIERNVKENYFTRIIRILMLCSSALLLIFFPIGTFFGLTLIQEFFSTKYREE